PIDRREEVPLALRVVEQAAPAFFKRELIHAALFVERQDLDLLIWTDVETAHDDIDLWSRVDADVHRDLICIRVRDDVVCNLYRKIVLLEIRVPEMVHFVLDQRLIERLPFYDCRF